MWPENVVDRLLPPTARLFAPRKMLPAPPIEPAVMEDERFDKSMLPAAPLMKRAVPPVLWSRNWVRALLMMVALPAVLWFANPKLTLPPLLVMVALPAVLWLKKTR